MPQYKMAQCVLQTLYWIISSFAIFGSVPAPFEVNESFVWKLLLTKKWSDIQRSYKWTFCNFLIPGCLAFCLYILYLCKARFFFLRCMVFTGDSFRKLILRIFLQSRRSHCLFSDNSKQLLWGERSHSLSMVTGWRLDQLDLLTEDAQQ